MESLQTEDPSFVRRAMSVIDSFAFPKNQSIIKLDPGHLDFTTSQESEINNLGVDCASLKGGNCKDSEVLCFPYLYTS